MIRPELPANEPARLAALRQSQILDTSPEPAFDDLALLASVVCATRMAAVSLIDHDREWFKAAHGMQRRALARDLSFCAHAILDADRVLTVDDTWRDPRFHDHPLATDATPVRFYAGAPLVTSQGLALGTLCVFDDRPAQLSPTQRDALQALSRQAAHLLELRRLGHALDRQLRERQWYEDRLMQYSTQLEALNVELAQQTRTDPLTGLPNRRAFSEALAAAMADEARRPPATGAPLAVALLDIDHFKAINDLHGHDRGDQVLRELSARLRAQVGAPAMMARYGGEEFVLLLPGLNLEQARFQCESLRRSVALMTLSLPVTLSIGVAALQPHESAEQVIKRADQALYQAKRGGRDRVVALA